MMSQVQQLYVMHVASLIGVAALAFRNQLHLRTVLLASIGLNVIDHVFVTGGANLNSLIWDLVALGTNLYVLTLLILDRTHVGLSDEEERLFEAWGCLTPGEFRKLLRLARWQTAEEGSFLTHEGIVPEKLFYVIEGELHLIKSGRDIRLPAPAFIGEVSFVKERPASATVRVGPGCHYVEWSTAALRQYFLKHQGMRVAVMRLLSADMAMKVARA